MTKNRKKIETRFRSKWLLVPGIVVLALVVILGCLLGVNWNKKEVVSEFPGRGLPVVAIDLNGVTQEEINAGSKDIKYKGNELSIYNNGGVSQYKDVEIKGRGNSTWIWDKRPYRIKFEEKVDVLGMGKAKKWCLLANFQDKTNLRTEAAFALEEILGMEYVMEGRFVELYIDNNYQGLYYLTQAVEVSDNVVALEDEAGVLVELDNVYGVKEDRYYTTGNGDILTVKEAVDEDNEVTAMEEFLVNYNELEKAVEEKNYARVTELADVESFAQYYLLSEFTVNPDAYRTSFYMYKDGSDDKIHAGPGWDFDMALANRYWGNWLGERLYSPTETMVRKLELTPEAWVEMGNNEEEFVANTQISTIMFDLMEMPEFRAEVERVFQGRMMGRKQELVNKVVNKAVEIYQAVRADGEKWNKADFELETEEMIQWMRARYKYMEELYGGWQDSSSLI